MTNSVTVWNESHYILSFIVVSCYFVLLAPLGKIKIQAGGGMENKITICCFINRLKKIPSSFKKLVYILCSDVRNIFPKLSK